MTTNDLIQQLLSYPRDTEIDFLVFDTAGTDQTGRAVYLNSYLTIDQMMLNTDTHDPVNENRLEINFSFLHKASEVSVLFPQVELISGNGRK